MKVAVLCEFSGTVRDAFIRRGHEAISCDLLDTESPGPHIKGDCLAQDWSGYDLVIAHPPCTYLCASGLHWNKRRRAMGRWRKASVKALGNAQVSLLVAAIVRAMIRMEEQ